MIILPLKRRDINSKIKNYSKEGTKSSTGSKVTDPRVSRWFYFMPNSN
jgi:hypothetical protein